jgi:LasA protease
MKKALTLLPLLAILLTSCGQAPPLWGAYQTPTPRSFASVNPMPPAISTATSLPTEIVIPTPIPPQATVTPRVLAATSTPTEIADKPDGTKEPTTLYYSQSGDTLDVIAIHFGVGVDKISSSDTLPESGTLLDPGTLLVIPKRLAETTPNEQIFPDSEIVYSATSIDFDTFAFVKAGNGHLNDYREYLGSTGWTTGAEGVQRHAIENALSPRLLLALVEYESGWLFGEPSNLSQTDYPLGYIDTRRKGMFRQMMIAVSDLAVGYYGWRDGTLTELTFPDGTTMRIAPDLNAGSVAIQYYFSLKMNPDRWAQTIDPNVGFPAFFTETFGDPWARAQAVEPLFPDGLKQPDLILPFEPKRIWAYTGGPHSAWEHEGAQAAIDFAPSGDFSGCAETDKWVVASASGLVVRSGNGVVILDLDGDGHEETGWNLLYLHIATEGRVPLNTWVEVGERIGQPSCEGGVSTGTHLHYVRKYNGEWILADGPVPFNLDGWIAHAGDKPYAGTLTRGDEIITASQVGELWSVIFRESPEEETGKEEE